MTSSGRQVVLIHRVGAVVVAVVIGVFGVLGLAGGLGFFDTTGSVVAGLSTNGALSCVSLVTAVILLVAAARGGRTASTVMMVVGGLFGVSAFVNLWLIGTPSNLLAFRLPNVAFSIVAGLLLLTLGAFGRASGRPPQDNPYLDEVPPAQSVGDEPALPERDSDDDVQVDVALAEATREEVAGVVSSATQVRLDALATARTQEERRRIWRSFDSV